MVLFHKIHLRSFRLPRDVRGHPIPDVALKIKNEKSAVRKEADGSRSFL